MGNMKKILSIWVVFILILSACTPNNQIKTERVLNLSMSKEITTFNPLYLTQESAPLSTLVYSSLFQVNDAGEAENVIVDNYSVNEEAKTITFRLKKGIMFHDDQPLTEEDVAFTYLLMMDSAYSGPYKELVSVIEKIEIIGDARIEFTLKENRFDVFTTLFTIGIIPKHIFKDVASKNLENDVKEDRKQIGSGPYKINRDTPNAMTLVANQHYFKGTPIIQKIVIKKHKDENSRYKLMETQAIDYMQISSGERSQYLIRSETSQLKIYSRASNIYSLLALNVRLPLFEDVRVRKAVSGLINRESLLTTVYGGNGTIALRPYAPDDWTQTFAPTVLSPEEATSLLAEAGWLLNEDGNLYKDDLVMNFTITIMSGDVEILETVQAIVGQLHQYGINITIESLAGSLWIEKVVSDQQYDAAVLNLHVNEYPRLEHLLAGEERIDGYNFIGYGNPELNTLLIARSGTMTKDTYRFASGRADEILDNDQPLIPLVYLPYSYVKSNDLVINENRNHPFDGIETWYFQTP